MAHIDFETKSRLSIKDVGAWKYSKDADVLCMSYRVGQKPIKCWYPGQPNPTDLFEAIESGEEVHAFNAGFEIAIWANVMVAKYGWPEVKPEQWRCSMARALVRNLSGGLDVVAQLLKLDIRKDLQGKKIMQKLSRAHKPTKKNKSIWRGTDEEFQQLYSYCNHDVRTEIAIDDRVPPMSVRELSIFHFDQRVNQRGIKIDLELVQSARKVWDDYTAGLNSELEQITYGTVKTANQVTALLGVLREVGLPRIRSLRKENVEFHLAQSNLPPTARRILEIRAEASLTSIKKFNKMLSMVDTDGRIRGCLQYHGAGQTGRWAGRGVQFQNLKRGSWGIKHPDKVIQNKLIQEKIEAVVAAIKSLDVNAVRAHTNEKLSMGTMFGSLVRSSVVPEEGKKFIVADFSSVEARCVAWLAEEDWLLEAFYQKKCPYKEMASVIYKVPVPEVTDDQRFYGKQVILGCFGEDTLVVTNRGNKRICDVSKDDLVWDGIEWVKHQGVVYQGVKKVITKFGVTATPDHQCLTPTGWQPWEVVATNHQSLRTATRLVASPYLVFAEEPPLGMVVDTIMSANVTVEQGSWFTDPTLILGGQLDATNVQKLLPTTLKQKCTGTTCPSCQTTTTELDYLTDCHQQLADATIQLVKSSTIMAEEELRFGNLGEKIEGSFLSMCKHSQDGMCQNLTWTELTMTGGMSLETYGSVVSQTTLETSVTFQNSQSGLLNYQKKTEDFVPVYDILNAGERHRFTIVTDEGLLVVHNCGYQMGAAKFQGLLQGYGVDAELSFCEKIIKIYRDTNRNIRSLWYEVEDAAVRTVRTGRPSKVGKLAFHIDGRWLLMRLPSGRDIAYLDPALVPGRFDKEQIQFTTLNTQKQIIRQNTYGGNLVENASQAICRDLLVNAMSNLERNNHQVVMHVHDEVIAEVPIGFSSPEEMCELMTRPTKWSDGFPIGAEAWEGFRYRK